MTARLVVVAILALAFAAAPGLFRRRQRRLQETPARQPPVPSRLLDTGADRTWVLFTTPWCASCGPVEKLLQRANPAAGVVKVDATRDPDLARAFSVRSAPTVLLAGSDGHVRARLVGAEAVERYLTSSAERR
jgi:glutaredoxin